MSFETEDGVSSRLVGPLSRDFLSEVAPEDEADTADTTLHDQLQIYGAQLECCTDWSIEEKIAFLDDEANRAFLREFSTANGDRIQKALAEELAFD